MDIIRMIVGRDRYATASAGAVAGYSGTKVDDARYGKVYQIVGYLTEAEAALLRDDRDAAFRSMKAGDDVYVELQPTAREELQTFTGIVRVTNPQWRVRHLPQRQNTILGTAVLSRGGRGLAIGNISIWQV